MRSPSSAFGKRALVGLALSLGATTLALGQERFLSPARGESLLPGSVIDARWTIREGAAAADADEGELVLSLDGGRTFPIRVSASLSVSASHLRWEVPALPTHRARLAWRTGSEGRERTETLRILSEEFAILPDPEGRREDLYERAGEWWTRPTPSLETADDGLSRRISAHGDVLPIEPSAPDMAGPSPSGLVAPPGRARVSMISDASHRDLSVRPAAANLRIPVALRL